MATENINSNKLNTQLSYVDRSSSHSDVDSVFSELALIERGMGNISLVLRKFEEEWKESEEEMRKFKEEMRKFKEEMRKSKEELRKLEEEVMKNKERRSLFYKSGLRPSGISRKSTKNEKVNEFIEEMREFRNKIQEEHKSSWENSVRGKLRASFLKFYDSLCKLFYSEKTDSLVCDSERGNRPVRLSEINQDVHSIPNVNSDYGFLQLQPNSQEEQPKPSL